MVGWRVLFLNNDETITIIHAGIPMSGYGGGVDERIAFTNILKNNSNFRMFEDVNTDSVKTDFAISGSAHCVTRSEIYSAGYNNTMINCGGYRWWIPEHKRDDPTNYYCDGTSIGWDGEDNGIRVVLKLRPGIQTDSDYFEEHTSRDTAWKLLKNE